MLGCNKAVCAAANYRRESIYRQQTSAHAPRSTDEPLTLYVLYSNANTIDPLAGSFFTDESLTLYVLYSNPYLLLL